MELEDWELSKGQIFFDVLKFLDAGWPCSPAFLLEPLDFGAQTMPLILLSISTGKLRYHKEKKHITSQHITKTHHSSLHLINGFLFPKQQL